MINLTPQQQAFVDAQVATGLFSEPTEVVQAGLDLLRSSATQREYDEAVADIRQGIEDYEQGKSRPANEVFDDIRRDLGFAK